MFTFKTLAFVAVAAMASVAAQADTGHAAFKTQAVIASPVAAPALTGVAYHRHHRHHRHHVRHVRHVR